MSKEAEDALGWDRRRNNVTTGGIAGIQAHGTSQRGPQKLQGDTKIISANPPPAPPQSGGGGGMDIGAIVGMAGGMGGGK